MFLAYSQLNSAVLAPPTWSDPVGDGAKRTRTPPSAVPADAASEETSAAACTRRASRLEADEAARAFWQSYGRRAWWTR